jgi:dTDP-4-dehydrorhamnose 3,5-epimerase
MRLEESPLPGVCVLELDLLGDERGWFARAFDLEQFRERGLRMDVVQASIAFTERAGTLRGMHYQAEPYGEPKLVRCTRGRTFHVALDLRVESPTYCGWFSLELSPESRRALYLPAGVAHGSQTLLDECEVHYLMGHSYVPDAARGVRWDDPAFGVQWPPVANGGRRVICERDRSFPDWKIPERQGDPR